MQAYFGATVDNFLLARYASIARKCGVLECDVRTLLPRSLPHSQFRVVFGWGRFCLSDAPPRGEERRGEWNEILFILSAEGRHIAPRSRCGWIPCGAGWGKATITQKQERRRRKGDKQKRRQHNKTTARKRQRRRRTHVTHIGGGELTAAGVRGCRVHVALQRE